MMKHHLLIFVFASLSAPAGCRKKAPDVGAYYPVEAVHLLIPKISGWVPDESIPPLAATAGGVALRLILQSPVAGSPRFDVVLEEVKDRPTNLEEFCTRNLQEMAQLENTKQIKINTVDQKSMYVGTRPAYRVHHEYTLGSGNAQMAINQMSTFMVLEGRGVAITAAGRTELYHPQSDGIELMFTGLKLLNDAELKPGDIPPGVAPVDLGKVGGSPAP